MIKPYFLDACAVIALLKKENGSEVVENLLIKAKNNLCEVYMNKYNLLEVYYGFIRADGFELADKHISAVSNSPLRIVDRICDNVFKEAGRLKAIYKISLADSIVLAEGVTKNAAVVTSDHHEFDIIEQSEKIEFLWIRSN